MERAASDAARQRFALRIAEEPASRIVRTTIATIALMTSLHYTQPAGFTKSSQATLIGGQTMMFVCNWKLRSFQKTSPSLQPSPKGRISTNCLRASMFALTAGILPLFSQPASADPPRVHFDVTTMIGCRDVTPPDFAELHSDERLIEARLSISSLIQAGKESDIVEFMYLIDSPQCTLQVADYMPKTTLMTDVVGSIGVERKEDRSRNFGLNVTGEITEQVKAVATGGSTATNSEKLCYERLPPLEMLSAAGTLHRSTGAYFKLKPSPRTSLEGSKDFLLILRVPAGWRADFIRVRCAAQGNQRAMLRHMDQQVPCGKGEFYVALYAEGDLNAKAAAAKLVGCEQQLRNMVVASRQNAQTQQNSSAVQRFGAILTSSEPQQQQQLPPEWFEEMLSTPSRANFARYAKHLPVNVRQSAEAYQSAKTSVQKMNGRP